MQERALTHTQAGRFMAGFILIGGILAPARALLAQDSPTTSPAPQDVTVEEPWLEPIPVPFDPELERQIEEVQDALTTIHQQMVRHKERATETQDLANKAKLYETLEALRRERDDLQAVLNDLVAEAKASQRTAIDEALARARWLEHQQERWYQKEELTRERKEAE